MGKETDVRMTPVVVRDSDEPLSHSLSVLLSTLCWYRLVDMNDKYEMGTQACLSVQRKMCSSCWNLKTGSTCGRKRGDIFG